MYMQGAGMIWAASCGSPSLSERVFLLYFLCGFPFTDKKKSCWGNPNYFHWKDWAWCLCSYLTSLRWNEDSEQAHTKSLAQTRWVDSTAPSEWIISIKNVRLWLFRLVSFLCWYKSLWYIHRPGIRDSLCMVLVKVIPLLSERCVISNWRCGKSNLYSWDRRGTFLKPSACLSLKQTNIVQLGLSSGLAFLQTFSSGLMWPPFSQKDRTGQYIGDTVVPDFSLIL